MSEELQDQAVAIVGDDDVIVTAIRVVPELGREKVALAEGRWKYLPTTAEITVTIEAVVASRAAANRLFPATVEELDDEVRALLDMDWVESTTTETTP
jgi:hypothetical protein